MSRARWAALIAALVVAAGAGISAGTIALPLGDVWRALFGQGDPSTVAVIQTLRVPRVLLATLVGAALGMSGAALQGTMRNPLAEPYLLGVSGGAAVGAVVATILGLGAVMLPLVAFIGAMTAV